MVTAAIFALLSELETDFITEDGHRVQVSIDSDGAVNTAIESPTGGYETRRYRLAPGS